MNNEAKTGINLVLGGVRSGKSRFAESLAANSGLDKVYIATARVLDDEISDRVLLHQERRGDGWETIEEPLALVDALRDSALPGRIILVDCLTFWITNLMMAEAIIDREIEGLISAVQQINAPMIFVSNEVGLGGISDNKMARDFADLNGTLNRRMAEICDQVYLVAAGLPLTLKG